MPRLSRIKLTGTASDVTAADGDNGNVSTKEKSRRQSQKSESCRVKSSHRLSTVKASSLRRVKSVSKSIKTAVEHFKSTVGGRETSEPSKGNDVPRCSKCKKKKRATHENDKSSKDSKDSERHRPASTDLPGPSHLWRGSPAAVSLPDLDRRDDLVEKKKAKKHSLSSMDCYDRYIAHLEKHSSPGSAYKKSKQVVDAIAGSLKREHNETLLDTRRREKMQREQEKRDYRERSRDTESSERSRKEIDYKQSRYAKRREERQSDMKDKVVRRETKKRDDSGDQDSPPKYGVPKIQSKKQGRKSHGTDTNLKRNTGVIRNSNLDSRYKLSEYKYQINHRKEDNSDHKNGAKRASKDHKFQQKKKQSLDGEGSAPKPASGVGKRKQSNEGKDKAKFFNSPPKFKKPKPVGSLYPSLDPISSPPKPGPSDITLQKERKHEPKFFTYPPKPKSPSKRISGQVSPPKFRKPKPVASLYPSLDSISPPKPGLGNIKLQKETKHDSKFFASSPKSKKSRLDESQSFDSNDPKSPSKANSNRVSPSKSKKVMPNDVCEGRSTSPKRQSAQMSPPKAKRTRPNVSQFQGTPTSVWSSNGYDSSWTKPKLPKPSTSPTKSCGISALSSPRACNYSSMKFFDKTVTDSDSVSSMELPSNIFDQSMIKIDQDESLSIIMTNNTLFIGVNNEDNDAQGKSLGESKSSQPNQPAEKPKSFSNPFKRGKDWGTKASKTKQSTHIGTPVEKPQKHLPPVFKSPEEANEYITNVLTRRGGSTCENSPRHFISEPPQESTQADTNSVLSTKQEASKQSDKNEDSGESDKDTNLKPTKSEVKKTKRNSSPRNSKSEHIKEANKATISKSTSAKTIDKSATIKSARSNSACKPSRKLSGTKKTDKSKLNINFSNSSNTTTIFGVVVTPPLYTDQDGGFDQDMQCFSELGHLDPPAAPTNSREIANKSRTNNDEFVPFNALPDSCSNDEFVPFNTLPDSRSNDRFVPFASRSGSSLGPPSVATTKKGSSTTGTLEMNESNANSGQTTSTAASHGLFTDFSGLACVIAAESKMEAESNGFVESEEMSVGPVDGAASASSSSSSLGRGKSVKRTLSQRLASFKKKHKGAFLFSSK